MDLDAVLLTHEHMDHIAGLDDLRAFSFAHEPPRDMPIYANAATLGAVQRVFSYAFSGSKYPGMPRFDLHAIDNAPFAVAGVPVLPVEVMHLRMPVFGFRIGGLAYITGEPGAIALVSGFISTSLEKAQGWPCRRRRSSPARRITLGYLAMRRSSANAALP